MKHAKSRQLHTVVSLHLLSQTSAYLNLSIRTQNVLGILMPKCSLLRTLRPATAKNSITTSPSPLTPPPPHWMSRIISMPWTQIVKDISIHRPIWMGFNAVKWRHVRVIRNRCLITYNLTVFITARVTWLFSVYQSREFSTSTKTATNFNPTSVPVNWTLMITQHDWYRQRIDQY